MSKKSFLNEFQEAQIANFGANLGAILQVYQSAKMSRLPLYSVDHRRWVIMQSLIKYTVWEVVHTISVSI